MGEYCVWRGPRMRGPGVMSNVGDWVLHEKAKCAGDESWVGCVTESQGGSGRARTQRGERGFYADCPVRILAPEEVVLWILSL